MRRYFRHAAAVLLAAPAIAAGPAMADDETAPPGAFTVTGHVALVTDYRFRGLSQSSGDPAIQGGIDLSHRSGLYAGLWSSSIDMAVAGPVADAVYGGQELDLYAGWTGPIGGGLVADLGLTYYAYPGGHGGKAEFFEPYASVSTTLGPVTGKLGVSYAWAQRALDFNGGGKDDSIYLSGELSAGIPRTPVTVSGHLGYADGALSPKFATGASARYAGGLDWSLGATYAVTPHVSLGGRYVGVEGRSIDGYANDALVGTLKLSF
jgi:uncharacterized protein (TIGR02001 family)